MKLRRILLAVVGLTVLALTAAGCFGPRTGEVSGKVTWQDGLPVVGAVVKVGEKTATTRSDGAYRITGIPHGTYQLTVSVDGEVVATRSVTIGRSPAVLNVELDRPIPQAPELVVIRSGITAAATERYPNYNTYIDALIAFLEPDYRFAVLTDEDVVDGKLEGVKLAILNDQGVMSQAEVDAFAAFVAGGGKIFATYSTSLRTNNETYDLVGFQLRDILGVSWVQFTQTPNFSQLAIVADHPIVSAFDGTIPISVTSRHQITAENATVVAVGADVDGQPADPSTSAMITVNDGGVYVSFPLLIPTHFENEASAKLIRSIIDYYAPGARKN